MFGVKPKSGGKTMKNGILKKSFFYSFIFFITSCVTINIYFPAAAVEKAADRIVEEVWGEKQKKEEQKKPDEQKQQGEPQSMMQHPLRFAISLIGPAQAFAQNVDINVTTPAIRTLKESIQKRADSIKPYMDSGNVGISNDGLLVVRSTDGLNLKDKAHLTRLIEAENKDRNSLYVEIAKANNFPDEKISEIKKIFAGSWIKNARDGWWFQNEDGKWKQK
jgi:uncharacterized protein YdbL (DUF1318 family)